ncbi:hypothetical protein CORT_0F03900 [Candida orthopsilosis Co 90-125]|uniref:Uncharacterized protein n=1 Tax=Candida orthopsilosis (strain 90-125) TaxID=1136231 RepID=H8X9E8_CANO9|nr:hypothetical protein CORT_0F03900 [Candida orthopsilosis Co 90-125]CCG24614.1 hypothetical protein CORT_0F03900 [Candida orthopsilosis Co 90-125]
MSHHNSNPVKAKINHYQQFLKKRSFNPEPRPHLQYIKLSVKEPQYIYKHHDQAYLKLGASDRFNFDDHHNLVSPLIAFNNSLISHSFYILMTLILVLIVSAVISFGVREYLLFQKAKKESEKNDELKLKQWSQTEDQEAQKITINGGDLSSLEKVIQKQEPLGLVPNIKDESGLTKFANDTPTTDNREWGLQQKYALTSAAISLDGTGSERRHKDQVSGFSDKSISKYAKNSSPLVSSFKDDRIRYTIAELHSLNTSKLNSDVIHKAPEGIRRIPISRLVTCSVVIPTTRFEHAWEANKTLMEISKSLNESELKAEKVLAAFKLVSIGKQTEFFENPNLFLGYFNTCIEDLVHTCILFDLWSYCSATLTVQLLECMLIYCWSHARYQVQTPRRLSMEQQFVKWNGRQPPIQSQMSILHVLFNLFLGLKTAIALPEDVAKENELKLGLVIRELIKKSVCNDYIQILPMIARASEASSNNRSKLFFYEMTKLLVSNHRNCCVNVYLKDSNFELKSLLKKGLSNLESDPIYKRSKEILGLILECGKEAEIWQLEVLDSESHLPSSLPLSSEYTERLFVQERKS